MTISVSLDKRLNAIVRKHERMKRNGVVHRVGKDGLIRTRPRLIRPRFPMKGALIVFSILVAFKVLMVAQLAPADYAQRVETLQAGTFVQQAGAVIMQEDRLTGAVGGFLKYNFF